MEKENEIFYNSHKFALKKRKKNFSLKEINVDENGNANRGIRPTKNKIQPLEWLKCVQNEELNIISSSLF